MDDQLEEEALVIAGTSIFLGSMSTILKYHERKDVEIPQISRQPYVNRDIDRENYINKSFRWHSCTCIYSYWRSR